MSYAILQAAAGFGALATSPVPSATGKSIMGSGQKPWLFKSPSSPVIPPPVEPPPEVTRRIPLVGQPLAPLPGGPEDAIDPSTLPAGASPTWSQQLVARWNQMSTGAKVGVAGVAAALAFLAVRAVAKRRKRMTPNARRGHRRIRGATGRPIVYRGKKIGRSSIPKKYRRMGVRRASQFAWPQGLLYPIHNAKHVRLAAARFGKWKSHYPRDVRSLIARRIDRAKRRYGIGQYRSAA